MAKNPKPGTDGSTEPLSVPPETRLVMVNPLSKGNLGKTTFYEYYATTLDESGIRWEGANMDNRHLAFQAAHGTEVTNYFDVEAKAVDEYQPVFSAVRRSTAAVYLIDQRAQADLAFIEAAQQTGFIHLCRQAGIRIVPVCFMVNDADYISNLERTVAAFAEAGCARWVVVSHPGRHANEVFRRTGVMRSLLDRGGVVFDMPYYSKKGMAHCVGVSTDPNLGGPFGFRDILDVPEFQAQTSSKFELEVCLHKVSKQFRQYADLFLPAGVTFTPLVTVDMPDGTGNQQRRDLHQQQSVSSAFMGDD